MFIAMCSSEPCSSAWLTNIVAGWAAKSGASPCSSPAQKAPAMKTRLRRRRVEEDAGVGEAEHDLDQRDAADEREQRARQRAVRRNVGLGASDQALAASRLALPPAAVVSMQRCRSTL